MNQRQMAPWLILIATAFIYLAYPTRVYYWDGIAFAQAIEDASSLNASLVHPNHLIYNFAGYVFYKLLRAFGFQVRAVTALQILNSLLSAGCAGVVFAILSDTLRSLHLSICLTLLFAFSATWWKFSTYANAYIPSVLFLAISFYLVLPNRKARPFLTAVTFFLSMAFHQLAVLMFPVLALGIYLQDSSLSLKRRALNVVYFSVVAIAFIAATYAYLFHLASGSLEFAKLLSWTSSYSPDADTKFNFWSNLQYSLRGQVRLFFGGRFNLLRGLVNPLVVLLIACLAGAVLWLIFQTLRALVGLRRKSGLALEPPQKTVLLLSLLWTSMYLAFLFFWLPQNTFYRLFYLPGLILLLGLAFSSFKDKVARSWELAIFVLAVALVNFLFLIYPFSHVEKYPPLEFALQMNHEWPAGTVIYYSAGNADAGLVRYFNPSTRWKLVDPKSLELKDGTAWLETTAIAQLTSTAEGTRWLETHARKETLKELRDGAYEIRFIQVGPAGRATDLHR